MFKRDRSNGIAGLIVLGLALFAVAAVFSWWSLAEYNNQGLVDATYQQNAEKDRADASEEIAQRCRDRNFIASRECIATALEAYYDQQSTDQDLQAQKDMAHWAKLVFWATVFTGVIGGAAVVYIAKDINVGRQLGRDQSRAYLHVKSVRWLEDNEGSEFTVFVENSGDTPVKRFEIFAECLTKAPKTELPSRIQPVEMKGWNGLPSNDVFQLKIAPKFIPDEQSILIRDTLAVYLIFRGVVRYTTIFDETYESEFSFMGRGRGKAQPQYEKYGSLGTKMGRTPEVLRIFEPVR